METGWDVYAYFGFTVMLVAVLYGIGYHYYAGKGRATSEEAKHAMMDDED